jgi:hypothetical protein
MAVFQQTFLGASITNFNTNLGLGSSSSTMSINLVGDDVNIRGESNDKERLVNGAREGYSYDSTDSVDLFPIELWKEINNKYGGGVNTISKMKDLLYNKGDYFWAPPVGSPVFFSYFDNKRYYDFQDPGNGSNINSPTRDYLRERWDASIVSFGGILKSTEKQWDASTGVTYSVSLEDPRSILEGTQVVLADSISPTAPPDQDMQIFFDVGGVERKLNRGFGGAYNILNPFGYYELRWDKTQTIFPDDFPFSYNRLDYANTNESGIPWMQDVEPSRSPGWQAHVRSLYDYKHLPGAQWALESMLGGWNETYFRKGEPFGGGLFYGQVNSLMYKDTPGVALADRGSIRGGGSGLPPSPFYADAGGQVGTHAYRFAVDLSELRKLHEISNPTYLTNKLDINGNREMYWGGTIPNDFRLQGQSMSLLQLIQQVCDMAGADFFVTLLPGCFVNHSNDNTPIDPLYTGSRLLDNNHNYYSGVIKINVMQRNREVKVGVISQAVHDATENHKGPWASDSVDCLALKESDCKAVKGSRLRCEWNTQISKCQSKGGVTQADVGREFTDAVSNVVMYGGARTRMVGVTAIGAAKKRQEIYIDQDNSQWNTCWALDYAGCIGHQNVAGFSDCTWDDYHKTCTGKGEQDPYFIEFLPNIELDGATLQGNPIDESVDSSYGSNNDEYINWQWHRHEMKKFGGVNPTATDILPHDRYALNSVSFLGSAYDCTYSYPGKNRKIETSDSGASDVDSCLFYTHLGRCSDKNHLTQASCGIGGGVWILDSWKDIRGLCGTTMCGFNKCTIGDGVCMVDGAATAFVHAVCADVGGTWNPGATRTAAVDNEQGCWDEANRTGGSSTYTAGSEQAVSGEEECARIAPYQGSLRYPPVVFIKPTSPNVSESQCKNLINADPTRVFIPNHWNKGDGHIDLYPMWGFEKHSGIQEAGKCSNAKFITEEDCLAGGGTWENPNGLVVTESKGSPILGGFNDDDPYRDFDEGDGLYSSFSYYNKYQGACHGWGPNTNHVQFFSGNVSDRRYGYGTDRIFQTENARDVAKCLDMTAHDEVLWLSYCNNNRADGSGGGNPFIPKATAYRKVHVHHCKRCTVGWEQDLNKTEELCIAANGEWVTTFNQVSSSAEELRTIEECNDPAVKGVWELQFKDPLTELEPVFAMHKMSVDTDDGYTSCEFRDFPSERENITTLAHNIGYCEDDEYDTPYDCQTKRGSSAVTPGIATGFGRPGLGDYDGITIWGTPSFASKPWVSKIEDNEDKNLSYDPKSFVYARPATATIPIDLGETSYNYGPLGPEFFGYSGMDFYYATVTELRHAAVSFKSWIHYIEGFDPWLACAMGWTNCPLITAGSDAKGVLGQILIPGHIANANTHPAASSGAGWNKQEKEDFEKMQVYNLINKVAKENYGRTYLMPLPMAPRLGYRCSDPRFGISTQCEEAGGEWGAYGFPNEWVRKLDDRGVSIEDRWEISSSAWVGDDAALDFMSDYPAIRDKALQKHVRYPQHANFWTTEGNCESFITYPRLETKRLEKKLVDLDFTAIDPEMLFTMPSYAAGNLGGKTQGKSFAKASVDPKVYWLPSKPNWETQLGREYWGCYEKSVSGTGAVSKGPKLGKHAWRKSCVDNGGLWEPKPVTSAFYKPYGLVTVAAPVSYTEDDQLKLPSDFIGCFDPKRIKIGSGAYRGDRALGVCLDGRYTSVRGKPESRDYLIQDHLYIDAHRELMYEGYGCHYDSCGIIENKVNNNDGSISIKRILKRFLKGGATPIQDEATCLAQPSRTVTNAGLQVTVNPQWSPYKVCTEMVNPINRPPTSSFERARWMPAVFDAKSPDDSNCETQPVRKETLENNKEVIVETNTKTIPGFVLRLDPVQTMNIPLTKSPSTKTLNASARNIFGNILFHETNSMGRTLDSTQMIDARYKPWYAGIPQQSNRFTWGPWSQTANFGKAEVTFDQSYHPGVYGGIDNMNRAAMAKVNNGTQAGAQLTNESGSVTISGLPEYKMGSPVQLYMVSGFSDINTPAVGPYITDISLSIGSDGISTTYRMQTQKKFGDTQSIYESKMLKAEKDRLTHNKRIADQEKHSRRPDPSSNRKK